MEEGIFLADRGFFQGTDLHLSNRESRQRTILCFRVGRFPDIRLLSRVVARRLDEQQGAVCNSLNIPHREDASFIWVIFWRAEQ